MEKFISNVQDLINRAENASDPRVKDWPLVQSIWSPVLGVFCYVSVVLLGPKVMKNRAAFELKLVMFLYNLFAVGLSAYMLIKILVGVTRANYSFFCQPVDYSFDNPLEMEIARVLWLHYLSKYFEMLDTFIFILRKKENQISFLHVYHHSSVVFLWWIGARWIPGGTSFIPALINSFVHVIMYTYYGLSSFASLRKYLWWKKYLTQLQMFQFCFIIVHSISVITTSCRSIYPPLMPAVLLCYVITLLLLFGKFYLGAYVSPKKKFPDRKQENGLYQKDENDIKKLA